MVNYHLSTSEAIAIHTTYLCFYMLYKILSWIVNKQATHQCTISQKIIHVGENKS